MTARISLIDMASFLFFPFILNGDSKTKGFSFFGQKIQIIILFAV